MEIKFEGVEENKQRRLWRLWQKLHIEEGLNRIVFEQGSCFAAEKNGDEIKVTYQNDTELYRSLLLAAQLIAGKKDDVIRQEEQFDTKGVMLDMSRAGVMKVEKVKEYIEYMALMGLNSLMLYMEDVFEVDGLEYFGYMRGRYSKNDLKEIDQYGLTYGVEVIPCIQTLGHFEQYIKWTEGAKLSDTNTVVMPEKEETYAFLDNIIRTVSECFTTRKIHIGMDEAWGLGTGNYLKQKGYKNGTEIFCAHIKAVKQITDKYHLKPMIWSDMYFRLGSKTGDYYDKETQIPAYVKELLPENVRLTYWDYYHHDEETYRFMIEKHKEITENLVFAGGIWQWTGFLPDYDHTFKATNAGLKVCKEEGVRDVYATIWGDDGCETDQMFSLVGCALYGEHSYQKEIDMEALNMKLQILFQADRKAFLAMSKALYPVGERTLSVKQILYSDPLCGLLDDDIKEKALVSHYRELEETYRKLSGQEGYYSEYFAYTAAVCRAAAGKIEASQKLHDGYRTGSKEILREVKDKLLPALRQDYEALKLLHYKIWHQTCRPFGFEVVDGRYGAAVNRLKTAELRLEAYLSGETARLEELEEKRLPFNGKHSISHFYAGMASAYMIRGY